MIKVSVSKLDQFRLFVDSDEQERLFKNPEHITAEDFASYIKGTKEQSKHAAMGDAFHDIIQDPDTALDAYCKAARDGTFGFLAPNGIVFPYKSITDCLHNIDRTFPFEVKGEKEFKVGNDIVTVTCRADQLKFRNTNDFKAIFRDFDFDKFHNSYQWRLYLSIFGAEAFFYYVYEFSDATLELKEITDPFCLYPYNGMDDDISELISDFLYYTRKFNLIQYMERP